MRWKDCVVDNKVLKWDVQVVVQKIMVYRPAVRITGPVAHTDVTN